MAENLNNGTSDISVNEVEANVAKIDHIKEKTSGHGIVLDNDLDVSGAKFFPRLIIKTTEPNAGTLATQVSPGEFVLWSTSATCATVSMCCNLNGVVLTGVLI